MIKYNMVWQFLRTVSHLNARAQNVTKSKNPLTSTMSNFIFTIPIVIINFVIYPDNINLTYFGIYLALCSGAIMSALGYSLWYSILPFLEKTIAALVQLLVPVIALTISILFLNEKLSYVSFLSSLLIICGVTVGICAEKLIKKLLWLKSLITKIFNFKLF